MARAENKLEEGETKSMSLHHERQWTARRIKFRLSVLLALVSSRAAGPLLDNGCLLPRYRASRSGLIYHRALELLRCNELRECPAKFAEAAQTALPLFATGEDISPGDLYEHLHRVGFSNGTATECAAAARGAVAACYLTLCDLLLLGLRGNHSSTALLRCISTSDCLEGDFADQLSALLFAEEGLLHADPAGIYPFMSGSTKQAYRVAAERIAASCATEPRVVLEIAGKLARSRPGLDHIGHYLLGESVPRLLEILGAPSLVPSKRPWCSPLLYFEFLAVLAALIGLGLVALVGLAQLSLLFALVAPVAFGLTFDALVLLSRQFFVLRTIAREPFSMIEEWPAIQTLRCLVAIPLVLRAGGDLAATIERVSAMACTAEGSGIRFAILADLPDSKLEGRTIEEEEAIVEARQIVEECNKKFSGATVPISLLFRDRIYYPREGKWWGWGRKAGKVHGLLAYLRGEPSDMQLLVGRTNSFTNTRFLIVLDEDSWLDGPAMFALIAQAIHPLNTPILNRATGRLQSGIAAIAPFTSSPRESKARPFAAPLMTPFLSGFTQKYLRDSNFDRWGLRQFSGKGLIDVEAAADILPDAVDVSQLLSHDLVEGSFLNCSFTNRAIIRDTSPASYPSLVARKERWTRGDLQNLFLLLLPARSAFKCPSDFGIFLILENARKSLLPLLSFLGLALAAFAQSLSLGCRMLLVGGPLLALYVHFAMNLFADVVNGRLLATIRQQWTMFIRLHEFWFVSLCLAPLLACETLKSLVRALYAVTLNRRLLEWRLSADPRTGKAAKSSMLMTLGTIAGTSATLLFIELRSSSSSVLTLFLCSLWIGTPIMIAREERSRGGRNGDKYASKISRETAVRMKSQPPKKARTTA